MSKTIEERRKEFVELLVQYREQYHEWIGSPLGSTKIKVSYNMMEQAEEELLELAGLSEEENMSQMNFAYRMADNGYCCVCGTEKGRKGVAVDLSARADPLYLCWRHLSDLIFTLLNIKGDFLTAEKELIHEEENPQ